MSKFITSLFKVSVVLLSLYSQPSIGLDHKNKDYIVVGGDYYHPPYEYLDEKGNPAGYNVELTREIAKLMGFKVKFQLGEWSDVMEKFQNEEIDIMQGVSYLESREEIYDYSPPHTIVYQTLFARKDHSKAEVEIADLKGKEVIVQHGDIMHDYFLEKNTGAKLVLTDTHADALRMLSSGKHDYAMVSNLAALYFERELGLSNILPVASPVALRYGYAVNKGNVELLAQFSEGLAILKNTGRHQTIYNKWFGSLDTTLIQWKKIGLIGGLISALLLIGLSIIFLWNRSLHRQVSNHAVKIRQHQRQLLQADKMASLGTLVSGVAHEINNPTSLLLLNLPVLHDSYQSCLDILDTHYDKHGDFNVGGMPYSRIRNKIPEMLTDMLDGANRIKRIVSDLKDFSKAGEVDYREEVDLNEVLATAIRLTDNSIRKATTKFKVSYGDMLPTFKGDKLRIEQVLINLILNACQALELDKQSIHIKTDYNTAIESLILTCTDEGSGIDPLYVNQITDPFFTTKRDIGGTGLGLFVSAGIVSEHGGQLEFGTYGKKGTRVTLTLPINRGEN